MNKKIYIAGSFDTPEKRGYITRLADYLRKKNYSVYVPMEHKIKGAWDMTNEEWGKAVYNEDLRAINKCDELIAIYLGWQSNTGTAWEIGYAVGKGIKTVILVPSDVNFGSLMVINSCTVAKYESFFYGLLIDYKNNIEQK